MSAEPWDLVAVGVKAAEYASTLCAAGGYLFLVYCAPLLAPNHISSLRAWVIGCGAAACLTSFAAVEATASSMSGGMAAVDWQSVNVVLASGAWRPIGARIVGLGALGLALHRATREARIAGSARVAGVFGACLTASSFVWAGHARAAHAHGSMVWLGVHLICAAFWLGALPALLWMGERAELATFALVSRRFGHIAVTVVLTLLIAGGALLCILLHRVSELWTTPYGRLIGMKIATVSMLLTIAAVNKLIWTPGLQAAEASARRALCRAIRCEMVIAGAVLLITASFTTLTGPTKPY